VDSKDLSIIDNTEAQRFEAQLGDDRAVAEYHLKNNVIIFTHTERGTRGHGRQRRGE